MKCARCRRPLTPEAARRVARPVAAVAAVAFAFMHGGMWAAEELSRDYCAPCRRRMTALALGFGAVILACAAVGVAIWLRGP